MNDSSIFGVSVRGLVTMAIVLTICILSGLKTEIKFNHEMSEPANEPKNEMGRI